MERPTYKKYWEANNSNERQQIIEEAFNLIDKLEKQLLIHSVVGRSEQLSKGMRVSKECDNTDYPEKTYTGFRS